MTGTIRPGRTDQPDRAPAFGYDRGYAPWVPSGFAGLTPTYTI
jgi:hypothetical protein